MFLFVLIYNYQNYLIPLLFESNFKILTEFISTPVFFLENFLIQLFIFYVLYLLITNNNLYYIVLYVFVEILLFGLFICFYHLELFTGFLWVTEFTVIFISIILLFYLNISGLYLKYINTTNNTIFAIVAILLLLFFFYLDSFSELELYVPIELNDINIFDDYYESLNNSTMNDFIPLTISYYSINSIEFLIIGLLLLLGSVSCINLYKSNKNFSVIKQSNIFQLFDFFKDFINFSFIRKQDLNKQTGINPTLRSIKKNN